MNEIFKQFQTNLMDHPGVKKSQNQEWIKDFQGLSNEIGVLYQIIRRLHLHNFKGDHDFFNQAQDFIKFCRPLFENDIHLLMSSQITVIIGVEIYFRCHQFFEKNCGALISFQTPESLAEADFGLMYEFLDIFGDLVQDQPQVKTNPANLSGNYLTLIEPKYYADFIENLMGEINRRLIDKTGDISELWHNLICKSISSKRFLFDKNRLQMKFFLQMQHLYLEEELGKRLQIA